jgi:hypothetical protein
MAALHIWPKSSGKAMAQQQNQRKGYQSPAIHKYQKVSSAVWFMVGSAKFCGTATSHVVVNNWSLAVR